MNEDVTTNRFHPSRVYARWKWTLRACLTLLPALSMLIGGITLFLTPGRYMSRTVFEIVNGPAPGEVAQLAASREVLERVVSSLRLAEVFDVDRETVLQILRQQTRSAVIPGTRMIRVETELVRAAQARDVADELPDSIVAHLSSIRHDIARNKAAEMDELIRIASDEAEERAKSLANLTRIHGNAGTAPEADVLVGRAKRQSILADAELERLRDLKNHYLSDEIESRPRLVVHEEPVIACAIGSSRESAPELGWIVVRAILQSLAAALLLPYLLEWVFPRSREPVSAPAPAVVH